MDKNNKHVRDSETKNDFGEDAKQTNQVNYASSRWVQQPTMVDHVELKKQPWMLYDLTESERLETAASKNGKTSISACRPDINEIPTTITMFSQSNNPVTTSIVVRPNRKYENQNGVLQTGNTYISACEQHRNEILTAIPMFSESGNTGRQVETLSDV